MAGETDVDQLNIIFKALGTPSEIEWPVRTALCKSIHYIHC